MGGVIDGFVQTRLKALMQTDGPVWRWRSEDPITASLNPSSPEAFAKAGQLRDLLVGGLPIKISVASFGSDVGMVEVASGGTRYRFTPSINGAKPLLWSASGGLPEASVVLYRPGPAQIDPTSEPKPGAEIAHWNAEGPWALFRVMDKADKQNAGQRAIKARFGDGGGAATLLVGLPSDRNPFSRGGLWSFRCPGAL